MIWEFLERPTQLLTEVRSRGTDLQEIIHITNMIKPLILKIPQWFSRTLYHTLSVRVLVLLLGEALEGRENEVNKADSGSFMTIVGVVQGLGMGLPDFKSKKKGKQQVSKEPHQQVVETLDKLREKTRETVKGLESMTASTPEFGNDPLIEDWVKQFEELAGSQVFSFVYFPQFWRLG